MPIIKSGIVVNDITPINVIIVESKSDIVVLIFGEKGENVLGTLRQSVFNIISGL